MLQDDEQEGACGSGGVATALSGAALELLPTLAQGMFIKYFNLYSVYVQCSV